MEKFHRPIAFVELLLIAPAVLFMTALFVRNLQPGQYEPARSAQQVVMWYAARVHVGLWMLLMALPLTVLLLGCVTLLRTWTEDAELRQSSRRALVFLRAHLAIVEIALATAAAAVILAAVALHVLTD